MIFNPDKLTEGARVFIHACGNWGGIFEATAIYLPRHGCWAFEAFQVRQLRENPDWEYQHPSTRSNGFVTGRLDGHYLPLSTTQNKVRIVGVKSKGEKHESRI